MNEKVLLISILALLGIGFAAVLFFIAVPWITNISFGGWKRLLIDDGIIIITIIFFVYGFYMNTKIH
jgi:hypothetical protein